MMTGYGYNPNLVQQPPLLQRVEDEWTQAAGQVQYYQDPESGVTVVNPMCYGFSTWSTTPIHNYPSNDFDYLGLESSGNPGSSGFSMHDHLMNLASVLPPPRQSPPSQQAPQPRISISDAELYQALNMSPAPTTSTEYLAQQTHQPQNQSIAQMPTIQSHPHIDYLSSEVCYPSTSSFVTIGYPEQSYIPPPSSIPPEDPHNYQHGNDGDDEESFGEPERYETMSPTFSIHSFAPTTSTNTAEAEDLEVELINNHKPTPRYQMADAIDIFLHTGTTDDTEYNDDSDSRPTTTFSHRSTKAPTPPASRPAYAQKLTAAAHQKPEPAPVDVTSPVSKTSPLFLQTSVQDPAGFTPLLTPNSDALLQKKLSEVVHQPTQKTIGLNYPAFPQHVNFDRFQENQCYEKNYGKFHKPAPIHPDEYYQKTNLSTAYDYQENQDILPILLDTFKPLPPPEVRTYCEPVPASVPEILTSTKKVPPKIAPSAPIKAPRLSDQELESESQKLAFDVISNLFSNKKEILDRAEKINAPKKPVARNLFCHDEETLARAKNFEPSTMSVLDDWETADDEDLTGRMENLLKDKKKEEEIKKHLTPKAPTHPRASDWDPTFLPHVLEIFGVPDYKMQEDVVKAMETSGNGDCKVMWMERKVVFAVFESVARAKNCLAVSKHDWLRFRSLADSPKNVQDSAKANASSLGIPKKKQQTTATVARRMVENALGKKASVSTEKRQEERKQLAAAKAAKKNTVQWD